MELKKYVKRVGCFILRGVPNVNVTVNISQIVNGNVLAGKTVLITGGGRGLGLAMAKRCIQEGAKVLIVGRNESNLQKASSELGKNCSYLVFDVSNIQEIENFMDDAIRLMGHIGCLISNAGISLHEANILDVSIDNFERQLNTNLKGSYFLAKAFIERQSEDTSGNIIFISSERGNQCDDVPYGLTKAAINSLTRGLSRRFYRKNIRVNAIAPGVTASDMTGRKVDGNVFAEDQAAGRYFLPEEVAEVTVFLLSDASKCISGEVIACDAGQYISSYYR